MIHDWKRLWPTFCVFNHSFGTVYIWLIWHLGFGTGVDAYISIPIENKSKSVQKCQPNLDRSFGQVYA